MMISVFGKFSGQHTRALLLVSIRHHLRTPASPGHDAPRFAQQAEFGSAVARGAPHVIKLQSLLQQHLDRFHGQKLSVFLHLSFPSFPILESSEI